MLVDGLGGDAEEGGDLAYRVPIVDKVDNLFLIGRGHRWVTLPSVDGGCQLPQEIEETPSTPLAGGEGGVI